MLISQLRGGLWSTSIVLIPRRTCGCASASSAIRTDRWISLVRPCECSKASTSSACSTAATSVRRRWSSCSRRGRRISCSAIATRITKQLRSAIDRAGQSCHGEFGDLEIEGVRIALLHSHDRRRFRRLDRQRPVPTRLLRPHARRRHRTARRHAARESRRDLPGQPALGGRRSICRQMTATIVEL